MRIKRLDIIGFKSFPDKSTLVFDKPIVGVVGPNGCGKSNIVDAIRWAMGEQSVKALRGSNREDVIFNGTENRAAMNIAEVIVTFDNTDGKAPPDYAEFAEISISRKLYRNGDSEYLINSTPCRLRDITDLFLGTGAGNKAYSIIEQGHVARILAAKADERRSMIEEAAGITKYYARKREAERKMDKTKQNLLRIGDIVSELKKQLNSLSRQAKKAERYRDFKTRMRELDISFAVFDYSDMLEKLDKLSFEIEDLQEKVAAQTAELNTVENDISTRKLKLAEREQTLSDSQEELHRLDRQIQLDERNIEVYSERQQNITHRSKEIEAELAQIENNIKDQREMVTRLEESQKSALIDVQKLDEALSAAKSAHQVVRERFDHQQNEVERIKRTIFETMQLADRIEHRQETLRYRIKENEERSIRNRSEHKGKSEHFEELEAKKAEYADSLGGMRQLKLKLDSQQNETQDRLSKEREIFFDLEERLINERDRLTAVRSRLESLAELDRSMAGFADAVKTVVSDKADHFDDGAVIDVMARLLETDSQWEPAIAAALGERLQWIVVADEQTARDGVALLRELEAGRAGFVPDEGSTVNNSLSLPDGAERLLNKIRISNGAQSAVSRLLEDVLVVDDLDAAFSLWRQGEGRFSVATQTGEFVDKSGAVIGGSGEMLSQTLLERRREIQELETQQNELIKLAEQLTMQRDERRHAVKELETNVEETRHEGHQQELKILEQEKDLGRLETEIQQNRLMLETLDREFRTFQEEMGQMQNEQRKLAQEAEETGSRRNEAENTLRSAQEQLVALAEDRDNAASAITDKEVAYARAVQQRQHLDSELGMAHAREKDMSVRLDQLNHETRRGTEEIEELARLSDITKRELESRIQKRNELKTSLDSRRDAFHGEQGSILELEEKLKSLRQTLESTKADLNKALLKRSEEDMRAKNLEERIQDRYDILLKNEVEKYKETARPGESEREEIESLRDRIERMGEVNLAAISEYDKVSERYQFLLDQQQDLDQSLEQLQNAINRINRTTRKRFKETFEEINRRFSELFPQLFGGGEAHLEFTDPSNLLTTGVEIIAQPPGKKLQAVNLLSGGEKALTALSLIFAIFFYRPTPFCLLDEVDAPLDDVNISRFNKALRRISDVSQFIVITHNKKTMEITNTLYGITMEEPGISKIVSVNLT